MSEVAFPFSLDGVKNVGTPSGILAEKTACARMGRVADHDSCLSLDTSLCGWGASTACCTRPPRPLPGGLPGLEQISRSRCFHTLFPISSVFS